MFQNPATPYTAKTERWFQNKEGCDHVCEDKGKIDGSTLWSHCAHVSVHEWIWGEWRAGWAVRNKRTKRSTFRQLTGSLETGEWDAIKCLRQNRRGGGYKITSKGKQGNGVTEKRCDKVQTKELQTRSEEKSVVGHILADAKWKVITRLWTMAVS